MKRKFLVVDDHGITVQGIVTLLTKNEPDWEFTTADNGPEAIKMASEFMPDVVLMDYRMKGMNGFQTSAEILKEFPKVKILMITMEKIEDLIPGVINGGLMGIISKEAEIKEIKVAVETILTGKHYFSEYYSDIALDYLLNGKKQVTNPQNPNLPYFSARELEILKLLAKGFIIDEVSQQLNISASTVVRHKANMFEKTNQHTLLDLIRFAVRNGIVEM